MRISDWSSDVCSSDLAALMLGRQQRAPATVPVFALLRTDHERAAGGADALPMGVAADDWLEEDPAQKRRLRLSLKLGRLFNRDPMAQRAARQQRLAEWRSEEHTSELQSLMSISYAVFCLKKKTTKKQSKQKQQKTM